MTAEQMLVVEVLYWERRRNPGQEAREMLDRMTLDFALRFDRLDTRFDGEAFARAAGMGVTVSEGR